MNERERQTLELLREALELERSDQAEFLATRCTDDPELYVRVSNMLARIAAEHPANSDFEYLDGDESVSFRGEGNRGGTHSADPLLNTMLGPFRVIERTGRGGMGVVYRGQREDADFSQEVAIKLIRRGFDFDDVNARFLRERRILARLSHPNLARFIDGGVAPDGRPWFALEFVKGESITQWCDSQKLDLRARVGLFVDVCAAVQYAHAQLVVHRDLKPGNVLVDAHGAVHLLDFGIALLLGGEDADGVTTTAGRPALTPEYAAPEQFIDGGIGAATDVYSLGVVLYELMSGVLPYEVDRRNLESARHIVCETLPRPLPVAIGIRRGAGDSTPNDLPTERLAARNTSLRSYRSCVRGDLGRIIEKALAKESSRRYSTVQAFSDDLVRWLNGTPVHASGNGRRYRAGKFAKRHWAILTVSAISVIALLATTALALRSAQNEYRQRQQAMAEVARSNAVRDYLAVMFRNATQRHESTALTASDVLTQGAQNIFEYFKDQPETGQTTALMLSELYAALGNPEGAAPLLEKLLIWPGIERNPEILASARYGMATAMHQRGDDERARTLLADAQAFWNIEPDRHLLKLSASRTLQAWLERQQGKPDLAIATMEKSIAEFHTLRGTPDPDAAYALVSLSITLAQVGRVEEALARARESVDEYRRLGEANSVEGLAALGNVAAISTMLGHDESALAVMREVSAKMVVFGASEGLAKADAQLGELLAKVGRFDEALPILRGALAMATQYEGNEGRLAEGVRQRLAQACLDANQNKEAEPLIDRILAHARSAHGEQHRDTGIAYRLRAQLRIAQLRSGEAIEDLDKAGEIFRAMGDNGKRQLAKTAALRARIDASGKPANDGLHR